VRNSRDFFRGCLLGGALGDALGWPVEFLSYQTIRARFGPLGIQSLQTDSQGLARITDDTQMTLFTAAGILEAHQENASPTESEVGAAVYHAYLHWLETQGLLQMAKGAQSLPARLARESWLRVQRGPGNTCLTALTSGQAGSIEKPINQSKGCGGVMRAAPIGLAFGPEKAFRLGILTAALTHGHPSGYFSAGLLAAIIAGLIRNLDLPTAIAQARGLAVPFVGAQECLGRLDLAIALASHPADHIDQIHTLGGGWVGEEALAIAIYCCLRWSCDFPQAVQRAVNHDGDSDSTGALTGNILGAYRGVECLPESWLQPLEGLKDLQKVADDMVLIAQDDKIRNRGISTV
jgi:ADP-ribosylglycohydrolase